MNPKCEGYRLLFYGNVSQSSTMSNSGKIVSGAKSSIFNFNKNGGIYGKGTHFIEKAKRAKWSLFQFWVGEEGEEVLGVALALGKR